MLLEELPVDRVVVSEHDHQIGFGNLTQFAGHHPDESGDLVVVDERIDRPEIGPQIVESLGYDDRRRLPGVREFRL